MRKTGACGTQIYPDTLRLARPARPEFVESFSALAAPCPQQSVCGIDGVKVIYSLLEVGIGQRIYTLHPFLLFIGCLGTEAPIVKQWLQLSMSVFGRSSRNCRLSAFMLAMRIEYVTNTRSDYKHGQH
jgi:hypothetical protein